MYNVCTEGRDDRLNGKIGEESMRTLIYRLYKFVLLLELRIKIMSDRDFDNFIKELDYEQKIYAVILRHCQ